MTRDYIATADTIMTWADATFGRARTVAMLAARAIQEAGEAAGACFKPMSGDPGLTGLVERTEHGRAIAEECADVLIVLTHALYCSGEDLLSHLPAPAGPLPWGSHTPDDQASKAAAHIARGIGRLGKVLIAANAGWARSTTIECQAAAASFVGACNVVGFDWRAMIDQKMQVNRERRWFKGGAAGEKHIKTPPLTTAMLEAGAELVEIELPPPVGQGSAKEFVRRLYEVMMTPAAISAPNPEIAVRAAATGEVLATYDAAAVVAMLRSGELQAVFP